MELLYWDFFGPRAVPTAEHFQVHLREFLKNHQLTCETFLESEGEGHQAVACRAPSAVAETLASRLRPQRRLAEQNL